MAKIKFWTHYVSYTTRVIIAYKKERLFNGIETELPIKCKIKFRNGFYVPADDPEINRFLQFFGGDREKAVQKVIDELKRHNAGPTGRRDFILMDDSIKVKNKSELNEAAKKLEDERTELLNEAKKFGVGAERIDLSNVELRRAIKKVKQDLLDEINKDKPDTAPVTSVSHPDKIRQVKTIKVAQPVAHRAVGKLKTSKKKAARKAKITVSR